MLGKYLTNATRDQDAPGKVDGHWQEQPSAEVQANCHGRAEADVGWGVGATGRMQLLSQVSRDGGFCGGRNGGHQDTAAALSDLSSDVSPPAGCLGWFTQTHHSTKAWRDLLGILPLFI